MIRDPIGHPNTQVTTNIGCDFGTRYRGRGRRRTLTGATGSSPPSLTASTRIASVELMAVRTQHPKLLGPYVEMSGVHGIVELHEPSAVITVPDRVPELDLARADGLSEYTWGQCLDLEHRVTIAATPEQGAGGGRRPPFVRLEV
jgi:hypothetical protein